MESEKRVIDIVKKNVDVLMPDKELLWDVWFKYPLISWSSMDNISIDTLWNNDREKLLDDLSHFLSQLHAIDPEEFSFL